MNSVKHYARFSPLSLSLLLLLALCLSPLTAQQKTEQPSSLESPAQSSPQPLLQPSPNSPPSRIQDAKPTPRPTPPSPKRAQAIQASDFYALASLPGTKVSAVFGTLSNTGKKPLTLKSVALIDRAGSAELHKMSIENGVAQMLPLDSIPIAARGGVELAPSGLHIMLLDLQAPLKAGETITLELIFDSGQIQLQVPIKEQARESTHAHH